MATFKVVFEHVKSTKNTERYDEQTDDGKPPRIGCLYVQRWALGEPIPSRLTVTVEE